MKFIICFLLMLSINSFNCQDLGINIDEFKIVCQDKYERWLKPDSLISTGQMGAIEIEAFGTDSCYHIKYRDIMCPIIRQVSNFEEIFYFTDKVLTKKITRISDKSISKPEDLIGLFTEKYIITLSPDNYGILIQFPSTKNRYLIRRNNLLNYIEIIEGDLKASSMVY